MEESISGRGRSRGRGRVRRDVASAGSRWPLFDVLGRRMKDKDKRRTASEGSCDSETFKRLGYQRTSSESTSGHGRIRRDVAPAGSRRPIFDVLGRHVNDKDRPQVAAGGAYNDEVSDRDLSELKKKTDEEENRSFFPSTSGENHEFYNFLLGEYGR